MPTTSIPDAMSKWLSFFQDPHFSGHGPVFAQADSTSERSWLLLPVRKGDYSGRNGKMLFKGTNFLFQDIGL